MSQENQNKPLFQTEELEGTPFVIRWDDEMTGVFLGNYMLWRGKTPEEAKEALRPKEGPEFWNILGAYILAIVDAMKDKELKAKVFGMMEEEEKEDPNQFRLFSEEGEEIQKGERAN